MSTLASLPALPPRDSSPDLAVPVPGPTPRVPLAPRHIGLGHFAVGDLERQYVNEVLDSGRLSYGRFSRDFEGRFAELHDSAHAVFCNSGTSALEVSLAALKELHGWADDDEVLVPAVTFVATSNIVLMNRMKPVFVDVHPTYYNLDPAKLEERITPRTRAIIPVHLFGMPCDMAPILEIANRHGLKIIEDSCETMFARYAGRPVGSFGDFGCFSTYIAHILVTGVGGLITTQDPDLAVLCRSLIAHGRDSIYLSIDDDDLQGDENRMRKVIERRFRFDRLGYSYRTTEFEAALGLAQLADWESMLRRRRENARRLTQGLSWWRDRLQLPEIMPNADHAFMVYPIVVREGVDRAALLDHLELNGIETRYLLPLINQTYYLRLFGDLEPQYPEAALLNRRGFYIGCSQGLEQEDIEYVIEQFARFFATH